jgi:hypothetical protein
MLGRLRVVNSLQRISSSVSVQSKNLSFIPSKANGELFTKILIANRGEIVSLTDCCVVVAS